MRLGNSLRALEEHDVVTSFATALNHRLARCPAGAGTARCAVDSLCAEEDSNLHPVIADAGKVHSALRVAERARTALPRNHHPVWLTEFSWEAVGPRGLSQTTQARYLTYGLYAGVAPAHREGPVVGLPRPPDPSNTFQGYAGVYTRSSTVADDRPRPGLASSTFQ